MRTRIFGFCAASLAAFGLLSGSCTSAESERDSSSDVVIVQLDTNQGQIVLELDRARAPQSVANFLEYVKTNHYDGTVFHRVIPDFMVQGGGMDQSLREKKTLAPIRNESHNGLKNKKYTVAMARTQDPHSATSQFFINVADNGFLNREEDPRGFGYAVFGTVVEGQEVVDKIAATPTQSIQNPSFPAMLMENVPSEPMILKSVKVLENSNN